MSTLRHSNENGNHATKGYLLVAAVIAALMLLSSATYFNGVAVGAQVSPSIIAPTVSGSIDTKNPGHESFWNQLTPLQIPLTATNDYGGATKSVSVKVGNNGTHMLFSATWSDSTQSNSSVSGAPSDPNYPQLFFANATYHRTDRFAVWWSLSQNPGPPPCMQPSAPGKGGAAAIAGTGNVWQWIASSSDSGGATFKTAKFGTGAQTGKLINYTHSYARNMFLNSTGFFNLGLDSSTKNSTIPNGENNAPYNSQLVWAKGVYDNSAHTWTLVAARPLTTTVKQDIQQFTTGQNYYFAVAAFDGGAHPIPAGVPAPAGWTQMADNGMTKSISTWYTMALSPSGPTASATTTTATSLTNTSATSGGISFEVAALVSFVMLLVGFIAGMTLIGRYAFPKR